MIPKKIHWCWLSGDPLPANLQKCIDSWKRIMPDYEIICWDKKRFDIRSVPFVEQAYACRKYAFAADYIRLYALYTEGGIYLDSDVMVFRRFDKYLNHSAFTSVEYYREMISWRNDMDWYSQHTGYEIQGAILGSEKGNKWIKKSLDYYKDKTFVMENGQIKGINTICSIMAKIAHDDFGFVYDDFSGKPQNLKDGLVIYPPYVFAALYSEVRLNTVCIHLAEQAWLGGHIKRKGLNKIYNYLVTNYRLFGWLHFQKKLLFSKTVK